jgi:S-adenosylmethionine:tRNA ribosyltransferase-isomerase
MNITEFDFQLPDDLIAQEPLKEREKSRMLVVNRHEKTFQDEQFADFTKFLKIGDCVVLNNTKVFPARLFGTSETGAKIELFLVREIENRVWETLARPARRLKIGKKVNFGENLSAQVLERNEEGRIFVKFETNGDFDKDRERYQTIFASERGAIAAPTAGLHFTAQILEDIKNLGATVAEITLHVGYGTFEPVRVNDLSQHKVLPEQFEISTQTAEILNRAKAEKRRIIAIGTTTTRTLETSISRHGKFVAEKSSADLTITPGYKFRAIDGILTNFHLPQSSLLVLTSTFGGGELIMNSYKHAVASRYRFYSYGDCMFVV